jgi:hypothetical protein
MASNSRNYSTKSVAQQCQWHCCGRHRGFSNANFVQKHIGVIDTAVADTVVSMTPLCQYDTAVPRDLEFERLWLPLQGISIKKHYICKLYYLIAITIMQKIIMRLNEILSTHLWKCNYTYLRIVFGLSSLIDTAVAKFGNFIAEYRSHMQKGGGPSGSCFMKTT